MLSNSTLSSSSISLLSNHTTRSLADQPVSTNPHQHTLSRRNSSSIPLLLEGIQLPPASLTLSLLRLRPLRTKQAAYLAAMVPDTTRKAGTADLLPPLPLLLPRRRLSSSSSKRHLCPQTPARVL